jgi:hypothetical protein
LDSLRAFDEIEHLGVEVDRDDAAAERDQGMRDAAGAGAELEDLGILGHLAVDELWLVRGLEEAIELDRRAWIAHAESVADGRMASVSR